MTSAKRTQPVYNFNADIHGLRTKKYLNLIGSAMYPKLGASSSSSNPLNGSLFLLFQVFKCHQNLDAAWNIFAFLYSMRLMPFFY